MLATVKLNIEVKDKFNGQYKYLIEIFTRNPLSDATATPLAAGYAKSGTNYTTEISIPKSIEHLFIRQTDPKQRQTVYQYITCLLYTSVSRVSGTLNEDARPIKAFIDTFPAGTLSGAPKVRAMQLISELEPHNRGAYGGCIGFIGLNGSLNQAITIRTFVSRNGVLWFQAGGGIVAKSNEEYELQEVNNKLGALKKAIIMAEKM